jgi:hypothetical protein
MSAAKFLKTSPILLMILALPYLCFAQSDPKAKVETYLRYFPSSSARAMPGEVKIVASGAEYSYEFKAFDKLPLKFSLDSRYIGIENSTEIKVPAHLTGLSGDIEATFPFFSLNKTYLRVGVSPSFYGDDWNFTGSEFRIPWRLFAIYLPNEKWTFLSGVAVYPDFQKKLLPILGFIYKPNNKLIFNILPKRPNISYSVNEKLTLLAEAGSSFAEFEVTKDDLRNVVLRYNETHLGAGLKYRLNKTTEAFFSAGRAFGRRLQYRDSLGKVNIKDSLYAEIRIELKI